MGTSIGATRTACNTGGPLNESTVYDGLRSLIVFSDYGTSVNLPGHQTEAKRRTVGCVVEVYSFALLDVPAGKDRDLRQRILTAHQFAPDPDQVKHAAVPKVLRRVLKQAEYSTPWPGCRP